MLGSVWLCIVLGVHQSLFSDEKRGSDSFLNYTCRFLYCIIVEVSAGYVYYTDLHMLAHFPFANLQMMGRVFFIDV